MNLTEVYRIANEIYSILPHTKALPRFFWKKAGFCGTYYFNIRAIGIHQGVWKHLDLAQKRILIIHELIHSLEIHHATLDHIFKQSFDILSLSIYFDVYGKDQAYCELENNLKSLMGYVYLQKH